MAKTKKLEETIVDFSDRNQTYNPLLAALRENDKKNLFDSNVTTAFLKTGFHLFDYYFGSVVNVHNELGEIVEQQPRVGQAAGTFNLLIGGTGSGKAQPVFTNIPTPSGMKRFGDLKVGDFVFDHNGEPTEVVGVFPQGIKDVYKVFFRDGRYALCCEDHLWHIFYEEDDISQQAVIPLKEIMKEYKYKEGEVVKYKYRIPSINKPVHFEEKDTPIHPIVLGLLLDDMHFNGNSEVLRINTMDSLTPKKIAEIMGWIVCFNRRAMYYFRDQDGNIIKRKDIFKNIPELNLDSKDLHIPDVYKYNSIDVRMNLFIGIMAEKFCTTDDDDNISMFFSSTSKRLLNDIKELSLGLGFKFELVEKSNWVNVSKITLSNAITHMEFDKIDNIEAEFNRVAKFTDDFDTTEIIHIEKIHPSECMCIKVANDNGLYLTQDFVVTHNTTLAVQLASNIIRKFPRGSIIHFDAEQRMDTSRVENISKLPITDFREGGRYILKSGLLGMDTIQEMIVKLYAVKMQNAKDLTVELGYVDEFGNPVKILQPTIIIIDSITSVISETFSIDNAKELSEAQQLQGNTEGARSAKTIKGFFKDILPLCKEANIIVYAINHINTNMSMNSFTPVAKQHINLKQDESIPGGRVLLYYPFNIIKLTAKPSDDFKEEGDGFAGHIVMIEPIKCSSNQSGNNSKGVSFDMVFSFKNGFDSLRSIVVYGRNKGIIEGTRNRLKFKEKDYTFSLKNIYEEVNKYPIWEDVMTYIVPTLKEHLSFVDHYKFDDRSMNY